MVSLKPWLWLLLRLRLLLWLWMVLLLWLLLLWLFCCCCCYWCGCCSSVDAAVAAFAAVPASFKPVELCPGSATGFL